MPARNENLIEISRPPRVERAMVVRAVAPDESAFYTHERIEETKQLAWTAGAEVVCTFAPKVRQIHPATLLGKGKLDEIKAAAEELEAELVIIDSELTPRQGANIASHLDVKVVDRTQLILDIFAQRAQTNEGKLQVELAQLQYQLPRLTGRGTEMTRLGGGIGTRGPGEQKLEMDRRLIRKRIQRLQGQLEEVRKHRRVQRRRRTEEADGTIALVGYTNAGKSSLLNALATASCFVEDKLFATLDPTSRRVQLPSGRNPVFTDTVGFIRELPHGLVAAFRATLEEVQEADLLLLVADGGHPLVEEHIRTVHEVLDEIEVHAPNMLVVLNKCDTFDPGLPPGFSAKPGDFQAVSALTGEGIPELLEVVDQRLTPARRRRRFRIPQHEAALVGQLHDQGRVLGQEYAGNDVLLEVEVDPVLEGKLAAYIEQGS